MIKPNALPDLAGIMSRNRKTVDDAFFPKAEQKRIALGPYFPASGITALRSRKSKATAEAEKQSAKVRSFPYADLIRMMIEQDQVKGARRLLEAALRQSPDSPELEHWRRVLAPPRVVSLWNGPSGRNRTNEMKWLASESEAHRGRWVALDGDRLLASAESLKDLLAEVRAMDPLPDPLIHRID